MSEDAFVAVCPICLSLDHAACSHTAPFLDVLAHDGEYFVHLTDYAALRAALAERDARIAALEGVLSELFEYVRQLEELYAVWVVTRPYMAAYPEGAEEIGNRVRAALTLTPPPPYPSASDQFTHTHHYPHGDEGDA
jgi:hypothetical protein